MENEGKPLGKRGKQTKTISKRWKTIGQPSKSFEKQTKATDHCGNHGKTNQHQ